mmetsp:Transcript_58234/g.155613  ORF Transcript_58234/g.155613 Transcript_58234/m.155613 type:complete len:338 (-) Transcript_58234:73-1086(-)
MADAGDDPEEALLVVQKPEDATESPKSPNKRKGKQKEKKTFMEKHGHLVDPQWWHAHMSEQVKKYKLRLQWARDEYSPAKLTDRMVDMLPFNAHKNSRQLQGIFIGVSVMLCLWPLVCFLAYRNDVHLKFWLGDDVLYPCLLVPCVVFLPNIAIGYFQCQHCCSRSNDDQVFSVNTRKAQWIVLIVWGLVGGALLVSGIWAINEATDASAMLIQKCGDDPQTHAVEKQWRVLDALYTDCSPKRTKRIQQCAAFRKWSGKTLVDYIEDFELEFECVGFCKFWAKPLFQDEDEANLNLRCASAIGSHVATIGSMVGVPNVLMGVGYLGIGLFAFMYNGL